MADTMPVPFVGHGSPMNAIGDNGCTRAADWRAHGDWRPSCGPADHFRPLPVVLGAAAEGEHATVWNQVHQAGALSMTSFVVGGEFAAKLVGPDGERRRLTEDEYRACCDLLWPEEAVEVEYDGKLTTGQAAKMLGVSRRTLTRMLDRGEIPCERMGKNHHRTVKLSDILDFRARNSVHMGEVYAALAQSERDVEVGRVGPAAELIDNLRADLERHSASERIAV